MIDLTHHPLDVTSAVQHVSSPLAGAVVVFLGTTRQFTGQAETAALDYECYEPMARRQLAALEREARERWDLVEACVVHRLGHLAVGEASIVVAVSSRHREQAFAAARWLIDSIKQVVPIWKREHGADGTRQWVHPGMPT